MIPAYDYASEGYFYEIPLFCNKFMYSLTLICVLCCILMLSFALHVNFHLIFYPCVLYDFSCTVAEVVIQNKMATSGFHRTMRP